MSEATPEPTETKKDQNDTEPIVDAYAQEKARLDAEYAKKKAQLDSQEAFGVYDRFEGPLLEDGRPVAGTYADYLAQRPTDGIVRDGRQFRSAGSEKFASEADYNAQNNISQKNVPLPTEDNPNPEGWTYHEGDTAAAARYYNRLLENTVAKERMTDADYAGMSPRQLALEAAKAYELGDSAEMNDIRETLDLRLLNEVTRPGTELTEAQYQEQMEIYDNLVKLAIQVREGKVSSKTTAEHDFSSRDSDVTDKDVESPNSDDSTSAEQQAEVTNSTASATPEHDFPNEDTDVTGKEVELYKSKDGFEKGAEVIFKGKKFTIEDVLSGDTVNAYVLVDADGNKSLAFAEQLTMPEKEASVGERVKAFWKKTAEKVKLAFRPEYWGERFTAAATKVGEASTWALNLGVDQENDSEEEKDRKRNRNRVLFIAGGLAVTVGAIAASYGLGFAVGSGTHNAAAEAAGNANLGGGSGNGGNNGASIGEAFSQQAPGTPTINNNGEYTLTPVDQLPNVSPPSSGAEFSISDPGFTIHSGEGGYELFNNLNLSPSIWDANKATLLERFPNDFYNMGNGAVGVNGGALSDAAKTFINTLRS
ncbi:MAG: hypothetical protein EOT05_02175 [Candidatus Microsaccharimonas sossegonensis]|uniref:Uncharacterized protein n=1 Tax=Candidatus Microsaccharimonas sossegonensis TaxID=2506948 RepID=A0A4Q0AH86_9BACT|nr:MAG: hypothetical protein EOT05_02175 [Candidatus Microsaccharimonas sossegonensis]